MRILFISHYSGVGGANIAMINLIKSLRKRNVSSLVLLPKSGPIEVKLRESDIQYSIYHYASLRAPQQGWLKNKVSVIIRLAVDIALSIFIGLRYRYKFDLIYANSSLVFLGIFIKFITRRPLVWHLREFGKEDYNLSFCLGKRISAWLYGKADSIISISQVMTHYYKNNVFDCHNVRTIYDGIEDTAIRTCLIKENNPLKICMVGGLSESKNQIQAIMALELLNRAINNNLRFQFDVIGGGEETYMSLLKNYIRRKGLEHIVQFTGRKNTGELYQILANYDVGLMLSRQEAFGLVTIEYMLAGVAVIATNSGANKELIKDFETGLFCELDNAVDLSQKICLLLHDKKLRERITINALQNAKQLYTAEVNAENIYKVIQSVCNV